MGLDPTTALSASSGCIGRMNAGFGARLVLVFAARLVFLAVAPARLVVVFFFAPPFFALFLVADFFFAADFFAPDFFFAADFFAPPFFLGAMLSPKGERIAFYRGNTVSIAPQTKGVQRRRNRCERESGCEL